MENAPFEDADDFPDNLWELIDLANARSAPEEHFIRVMWFHGDFLNGGLNQVMYNVKEASRDRISDYINSFDAVGLSPFATVIALADKEITVGKGWQSIFNRKSADLDKVYSAMAFGFPVADQKRFKEFLSERADGYLHYPDWVARAALKYARDNVEQFGNIRRLWRESRG